MRSRVPSLLREEFQRQAPQQLPLTPTVPAATFRNLSDCDSHPQGPIQDTPQHVLSSPHPVIDPTALYVVQPAVEHVSAPIQFQLIYPPFSSFQDSESTMSYSPGNSAGSAMRPLSASVGFLGVHEALHFGQMAPFSPAYAGHGAPFFQYVGPPSGMSMSPGNPMGPSGRGNAMGPGGFSQFGGQLARPMSGCPMSGRPLSARPSSSFMHEMRPPLASMSAAAQNEQGAQGPQSQGQPQWQPQPKAQGAPNATPKATPKKATAAAGAQRAIDTPTRKDAQSIPAHATKGAQGAPARRSQDLPYKTPESKTKARARATPSKPRAKRATPMTPALRTALEPSPTPARKSRGCWTCKCRRKRCDERQPKCETCAKLDLPCFGFSLERPEHMSTPEKSEAVRHHLATLTRNNRRHSGAAGSPLKQAQQQAQDQAQAFKMQGAEN